MKMKQSNKLTIKKHSAVIQISNIITAQQRKIFNCLLHLGRKEVIRDNKKDIFKIPLAQIKKLLDIRNTNNKEVKKNFKKLVDTQIEYNILDKDNKEEWGIIALLAEAKIKDGMVRFGFAPSIRKTMLYPRMYALLDLNILKCLKSKYSIALYELAKDYLGKQIPRMSIDKFRSLMGLSEEEYINVSNLKKKVINVAIDEINKKTDLNIKYILEKEWNKYTSIKFFIEKKKDYKEDDGLVSLEIEKIQDEFKKRFNEEVDYGLIKELIEEYGADKVFENMRRINTDKNKIINPVGYLIASLREEYDLPKTWEEIDEERSEREELIKERKKAEEEELVRRMEEEDREEYELRDFYSSLDSKEKDIVDRRAEILIVEKYNGARDSITENLAFIGAIKDFKEGRTFWDTSEIETIGQE